MNFTSNLEKSMECLHKQGAFLTSKVNGEVNTMTISWGSVGFIWKKPIFTVLVRKSRHTHELIENHGEFTVSIPWDDKMKNELATCGTKSGREMDKIKECNLELRDGKSVSVPVISGCGIHYECKVVLKQEMCPNFLEESIDESCYGTKDYHTIYYAEIVNCYLDEK